MELLRALGSGVYETAHMTFLLLIAVQFFHAGPLEKSMLSIGMPLGLLASPMVLALIQLLNLPAARGAAYITIISVVGMSVAAVAETLLVYVAGCMVAAFCAAASIPLITQIYQDNYPKARRGSLFSRTVMVRVSTAAGFAWLAGNYLAGDLGDYPKLMLVFASALALVAFSLWRIPSMRLKRTASRNPLNALRHVKRDAVFRRALISFMFMGFANLMMLPLRVDYIANPVYGHAYSPEMVAILTGMTTSVAHLLLSWFWGRLFDRLNFFLLRILLNLVFVAAIASYFLIGSLPGFFLGSALFGAAMAGGNVAWSLYVTKLAPPGLVAEYMAAHTFTTGLRGVAAPITAFYVVTLIPVSSLAWVAILLIGVACLILLPEVQTFYRRRPATPLPNSMD